MIEDDRRRKIVLAEDLRGLRVVLPSGISFRRRDENSRDRVMARIAPRVGIAVKLFDERYVERGFLFRFSQRRLLQAFAVIDESSRQRPPMRRIFSLDQDDAGLDLDNDVDCRQRILYPLLRPLWCRHY